jgi:hypothetical protein
MVPCREVNLKYVGDDAECYSDDKGLRNGRLLHPSVCVWLTPTCKLQTVGMKHYGYAVVEVFVHNVIKRVDTILM